MPFEKVRKCRKRTVIFLAVLGLRCCVQAFSSGGKWGLLSSCSARASHDSGFSCCKHRLRGVRASVAGAQEFSRFVACGILVPSPGIKPAFPNLQGEVLTTGLPKKP